MRRWPRRRSWPCRKPRSMSWFNSDAIYPVALSLRQARTLLSDCSASRPAPASCSSSIAARPAMRPCHAERGHVRCPARNVERLAAEATTGDARGRHLLPLVEPDAAGRRRDISGRWSPRKGSDHRISGIIGRLAADGVVGPCRGHCDARARVSERRRPLNLQSEALRAATGAAKRKARTATLAASPSPVRPGVLESPPDAVSRRLRGNAAPSPRRASPLSRLPRPWGRLTTPSTRPGTA